MHDHLPRQGFSETPPFFHIFRVKWNDEIVYTTFKVIVERRTLSENAHLANLAYIDESGPITPVVPDVIRETLLTYGPNLRAWPWGPGIVYPTVVDPGNGLSGSIAEADFPALPGVSTLGVDVETREYDLAGYPGSLFTSVLGRHQSPGLRGRTSGVASFAWPSPPAPPTGFAPGSYDAISATWGSPAVLLEFYDTDPTSPDSGDPYLGGGSTLFTHNMNFAAVHATTNLDNPMIACAAAVMPKWEGWAEPIHPDHETGLNSVRSIEIWVVCQKVP